MHVDIYETNSKDSFLTSLLLQNKISLLNRLYSILVVIYTSCVITKGSTMLGLNMLSTPLQKAIKMTICVPFTGLPRDIRFHETGVYFESRSFSNLDIVYSHFHDRGQ